MHRFLPSRKRSRWRLAFRAALAGCGTAVGLVGALHAGGIGPRAEALAGETVWRRIFARPPVASENARDRARIALGRDLFRDRRLSGDGRASCATCHDPDQAFTDGRATGRGPSGAVLPRNVPALYNLAWATSFFWDGRAASLAEQALSPLQAPDEMAADLSVVVRTLSEDAEMSRRFAEAFLGATTVTATDLLEALAAYQRSLVSPAAPFDRWVAGDETALTPQQRQGFDLFVGKAGCVSCHGGWRFTDDAFHDIGLPGADRGRGALAPDANGLPEFKTPSLREVARTAPYMHDGSRATLREVVDHYAGGIVQRPSLSPTLVRDLRLTDEERAALVAFLETLSGERETRAFDETPRLMLEK